VSRRSFTDVDGAPIEYELTTGDRERSPLVFLHEGLGSIDLWRGVPDEVAAAAGEPTVLTFARHGYGASGPAQMPRPVTYMHNEADVVLPALLEATGLERPVLVGHSDGASIALLYAGAGNTVAGLACLAPHVFVEPASIAGIEQARVVFESTDMSNRMVRYHHDPVATFRGWNDVWLNEQFRSWNIEDRLGGITAPVLAIQGRDDQYGTVAQLDAIEAGVAGPFERLVLDGIGHSPHTEARGDVVTAIAQFVVGLANPPIA
jgi:pimeloyl-ACP methyl ester carboxylesterase